MGVLKMRLSLLSFFILLQGCAIPRSGYELKYTYAVPPKDAGDVRVMEGTVKGNGLSLGRLLTEHERAFNMVMEAIKKK